MHTNEFDAEMSGDLEKTDVRHWLRHLTHRKYGDWSRPDRAGECSVRISHEGTSWYFPLGTKDPKRAANQALGIYRSVITDGWSGAYRQHPREFTLGLFWATNPATCTYTTLFTAPKTAEARKPPRKSPGSLVKVGIVEADEEIATALVAWADRCPGYVSAAHWTKGSEALRQLKANPVDLLLYNRHLPDLPATQFGAEAARLHAGLPAFGYGIYENSDDIFISLTGVTGGYFFRRRPPDAMLEPVDMAWGKGSPSPEQVQARIRNYFQSLLILPHGSERPTDTASLTLREQEILHCLRKGMHDKEMARVLEISAWTVHTHLKNIFEKLGVHTRTEAVIKFLQK